MPFNDENVKSTFRKNNTDPTDAVWFGVLYQQMMIANDYQKELADRYTEEEREAIGFDDHIDEDVLTEMQWETVRTHMKNRSFEDLKNLVLETHRANKKIMLENEVMYRQVLNSLPENEPDREAKANYLFHNGALASEELMRGTLQDIEIKAKDHLISCANDLILDGAGHNGDVRQVTIGEVLDRLGMSEAEKEQFIQKRGYTSQDETIYESEIRRHPDVAQLPVRSAMDNAMTYLNSCLLNEAHALAEARVEAEMTPDERARMESWRSIKAKRESEDADLQRIDPWIRETGKDLSRKLRNAHTASVVQKTHLIVEGDKSINDISPNAPSKDTLSVLEGEISYVSDIIKGTRNGYDVVDELAREGADKISGLERKSAEEFINDIRRRFRDDRFDKTANDYPIKPIADIFAARILSEAVRGKKSSLSKEFTKNNVEEMSLALKHNNHFRSFVNGTYISGQVEGGEKFQDTAHRLYSSRTHGGFIEDEFRKYLLKLPAGELKNSPELARFMPTAKERIEELKRQVKNNPGNKDLQENASAEIIAIRNACKVERKSGYGLDRQIPPAKEGKTIDEEVRKLRHNDEIREILRSDELRDEVLSGHGGQMLISVREKYEKQVPPADRNSEALSILKRNTVGGRLSELSAEARELKEQLSSRNSKIRNQAHERSKEILCEYISLADKGKYPQGKENDAPWKEVDKVVKNSMTNASLQAIMKTPEKAAGILNVVGSGDLNQFQNMLTQEISALRAPKAQVQQPVIQQPVNEAQGPQGPVA